MSLPSIAIAKDHHGGYKNNHDHHYGHHHKRKKVVEPGPRPYYLVDKMEESKLKTELQKCSEGPFKKTKFSIGHRGAGIIECDVTFTKDRELVCRHSQCDLHTTTNFLTTDLATKCSEPFTPAQIDPDTGEIIQAASAKCCTSDITLAEFKTLQGKMDASNPAARTDLYRQRHGNESCREYRAVQETGCEDDAGVDASKVFAQSFNLEDIMYWITNAPDFGKQAVYLDDKVYEASGSATPTTVSGKFS